MTSTQLNGWVRQVLGKLIIRVLEPPLYGLAFLWRRALVKTRFILVTGSLGKTTAKEALGRILASRHPTFRSVRNQNARRLLSLNILRVRPWHRFAVIEAGTGRPGELSRSSKLLRPDVAVVLVVAGTHRRSFGSLDEIAVEKLSALEGLRKGGTAIINADDKRLSHIDSDRGYQVLKFGTSSSCDLYAENIKSQWPGGLTFEARTATERVAIGTQLAGTHWIPSILASLLAAKHCGFSLAEAAETTPLVRPFAARMQPVQMPSGAIVIRDEYNGSPSSFHTALEFFEAAKAKRKILIAGDYSDSVVKRRRRLTRLGRTAAGLCDLAIFIGESSYHSKEGAIRAGMDAGKAFSFSYPKDAVSLLQKELRKGDLVMLKSRSNDHLSRLLFAQVGKVECWRPTCLERFLCDICWRLGCDTSDMAKIRPL